MADLAKAVKDVFRYAVSQILIAGICAEVLKGQDNDGHLAGLSPGTQCQHNKYRDNSKHQSRQSKNYLPFCRRIAKDGHPEGRINRHDLLSFSRICGYPLFLFPGRVAIILMVALREICRTAKACPVCNLRCCQRPFTKHLPCLQQADLPDKMTCILFPQISQLSVNR